MVYLYLFIFLICLIVINKSIFKNNKLIGLIILIVIFISILYFKIYFKNKFILLDEVIYQCKNI